jgi:arylformamidase
MSGLLSNAQLAFINAQYLPRLSVGNADEYLARWIARSAEIRQQCACRSGLRYGDSPRQAMDVFPAARPGAPVLVFIHGGYWRALDKDVYGFVAEHLVAAGATVVLPGYDLCPQVRITDIVDQLRKAIAWVHANIAAHNGDPERIHVAGHSAGAHLAAMMVAIDWTCEGMRPDLIKGSTLLSGVFDIEPHRHSQLQPDIRLTKEEARAMSPMYLEPQAKGPSLVAVGSEEPDLFHWQSLEYAARLRLRGVKAEYVSMPGDNHFDIAERLLNAADPLTVALLRRMGLG